MERVISAIFLLTLLTTWSCQTVEGKNVHNIILAQKFVVVVVCRAG